MNFKTEKKIWRWFSVGLTLGSLVLNSCGKALDDEEWADSNFAESSLPHPYPTFRGQDFQGEKNFALLINNYTKAKVEPTPWAGFWWPYTGNGIAAGGNGGSPAGKYDAARGHRTQAQSWEVRMHGAGVPKVQQWWGHCNGWTASSALFPEPHEAVTVNGVQFGIGDIKALLSEAGMSVTADFFGERIDVDDETSHKYRDVVPDQYFLVLTNYIGKQKKAVLIDRYTGSQVWNQPLAGYEFEYPKPADYLGNSPEAPNVYRILVTSTIWWMDDGVPPDIQTPPFRFEDDSSGVIQSRTLKMEIWLDAPVVFDAAGKIKSSGNVIVAREGEYIAGGAWRLGDGYMVDAWPDYMWVPYGIVKPTDPDQDYANPEVDIDWIKAHLLVPGGADDPSVTPGAVEAAPPVRPSSSPTGSAPGSNPGSGSNRGSNPTPSPSSPSSSFPWPLPTALPSWVPSIPRWTPTAVPPVAPPSPPTWTPPRSAPTWNPPSSAPGWSPAPSNPSWSPAPSEPSVPSGSPPPSWSPPIPAPAPDPTWSRIPGPRRLDE
jgi:hypothetical protein